MRILLIGGDGQLGRSINHSFKKKNIEVIVPNSKNLNLLNNESIDKFFTDIKPEIVVNCAAYTNVDKAEIDSKKATQINSEAPKYLAMKIEEMKSFMIQISTDYVFGNNASGPFSNLDKTDPVNIYGETKRDGEVGIKSETNNFLIIRTASLMSKYNGNFASSIASKLLVNEDIKIIKNQKISMTCANFLAEGISSIIDLHEKINLSDLSENRIINFTNYGYTDWYSIGKKIQERLIIKGLLNDKDYINPIMSSEWKSSSQRPKDSRLLLDDKVFNILNIDHKRWEDSLIEIIDEYLILNGFINNE